MKKTARSNSPINTNSDTDDYWLRKFEENLQKLSVQPRTKDENLVDQIASIMNGSRSKFNSIQEKLDDMFDRSGYSAFLAKKASDNQNAKENKPKSNVPVILVKVPAIKQTLENCVKSTRGNLSVPSIIEKIKTIHQNDISDVKDLDDDNFIKLVSHLNLQEKANNPNINNQEFNLGTVENTSNNDIDSSNREAFPSLNVAKM